jgi:hypothetical protein
MAEEKSLKHSVTFHINFEDEGENSNPDEECCIPLV